MRTDPLPTFAWKFTLNGLGTDFIKSVAVPTETSMVIGLGITVRDVLVGWALKEMQGQRLTYGGNLITLDTALNPVYCDAWDSAFIQQAEISGFDGTQPLMSLTLNLQVTNLREVPLPGPGSSATALVSRANSRPSQLRQRLLGRTARSSATSAHTGRRDPLPVYCFKITMSGSNSETFVSKLGALTYNSGVISPFVVTMPEDAATDYRAWKQAGGQRDLTIRYLDSALNVWLTVVFGGCTVMQIVPAVPIGGGPTSVMLNVSHLTITTPPV